MSLEVFRFRLQFLFLCARMIWCVFFLGRYVRVSRERVGKPSLGNREDVRQKTVRDRFIEYVR